MRELPTFPGRQWSGARGAGNRRACTPHRGHNAHAGTQAAPTYTPGARGRNEARVARARLPHRLFQSRGRVSVPVDYLPTGRNRFHENKFGHGPPLEATGFQQFD